MGTVNETHRGNGPNGRLFYTQNDIPETDRAPIIEALNRSLADTTDVMTQTKYAHWNVRGPNFYHLHLLFDEIAETLEDHADLLAERATALGGEAIGTARMTAANSRIPEIRTEATTGMEYVEALADSLAVHAANLRGDVDATLGYGDQDTADLYIEVSREIDKQLWFLEAHLQRQPVSQLPVGSGQQTLPSVGNRGVRGSREQSGQVDQRRPPQS